MLINVPLLMEEVHASMLTAIESGRGTEAEKTKQYKELLLHIRLVDAILIALNSMPDIVVEVLGDEYFTIDFPR